MQIEFFPYQEEYVWNLLTEEGIHFSIDRKTAEYLRIELPGDTAEAKYAELREKVKENREALQKQFLQ